MGLTKFWTSRTVKYTAIVDGDEGYEAKTESACACCQRRDRYDRVIRGLCWLFGVGVLVSLLLVVLFKPRLTQTFPVASWSSLPEELHLPFETVVFAEHPIYSDPPSEETNAAWEELTEDPTGYVYITDREKYGLNPGISTPEGEVFGITMFHALHCLRMIRNTYWSLTLSMPELAHHHRPSETHNSSTAEKDVDHLTHCFDYLRQNIECAGDMTIGWADHSHPDKPLIDGWGVAHHQCRNWRSAIPYLKEHEAPGSMRNMIESQTAPV